MKNKTKNNINNDIFYDFDEEKGILYLGHTKYTEKSREFYSAIDAVKSVDDIKIVIIRNKIKPLTMACWFANCANLTEIRGIQNIDTSMVYSTESFISNCSRLTKLDFSTFVTPELINMSYMCSGSGLTELDISSFDMSKVKTIIGLCYHCVNLKKVIIGKADTSNVKYMSWAWQKCYSLEEIEGCIDLTSAMKTDLMFADSGISEVKLKNFDLTRIKCREDMFLNTFCIVDNISNETLTSEYPYSVKEHLETYEDLFNYRYVSLKKIKNSPFDYIYFTIMDDDTQELDHYWYGLDEKRYQALFDIFEYDIEYSREEIFDVASHSVYYCIRNDTLYLSSFYKEGYPESYCPFNGSRNFF